MEGPRRRFEATKSRATTFDYNPVQWEVYHSREDTKQEDVQEFRLVVALTSHIARYAAPPENLAFIISGCLVLCALKCRAIGLTSRMRIRFAAAANSRSAVENLNLSVTTRTQMHHQLSC